MLNFTMDIFHFKISLVAVIQNYVDIVVSVGDENDNAPYFLDQPLVLGVPADAMYNHHIGSVQVRQVP